MEVCGKEDFKERTLRSLKHGLGKLWRRRSVTITEYDPCYKVAYLGNVITGWAKGEGCVEKPLCTLWKNYNSTSKPDVQMKLTVTQSGLKAVTKEHGLTEYWSHRITYCVAPSAYPKVFCWVYRHEGRKLKQELRCHAVLCRRESTASRMATELTSRLSQALTEFKRDKLSRQNARLSLANAVYDNPSLPRRKILLSTGSHNYRPPLERSKSAPKLMSIEESIEEDEEIELRKSFRRPRYNSSFTIRNDSLIKKSESFSKSVDFDEDPRVDTILEDEDEELDPKNILIVEESNLQVIVNPFGLDNVSEEIPWKPDCVGNFDDEYDDLTATDNDETEEDSSRIGSISDEENQLDVTLRIRDDSEESPTTNPQELALRIIDDSRNIDRIPLPLNYNSESLKRLQDDSNNVVPDLLQNTNSLVRNRRKLFENLKESQKDEIFDEKSLPLKNTTLIENRKRLFEHSTYDNLNFNVDKTFLDLEDDSTPSLQSISSSSGSDTSTKTDSNIRSSLIRNVKPHYDLDSLSEEDSDESGYVESVPQETSDDKERDLPHHHLVKSCVLTPKTACLQV